jgi:hypothetical protein
VRARVFIAVMLLVLAAALFIAVKSPRKTTRAATHFKFVGFQNATNGMFDAIFFTTNWPRETTSWNHEGVSYRTAQGWQPGSNYPLTLHIIVQNQTNIMVNFRVPGTNMPMRTVTRLASDPSGWRNSLDDWFRRTGIRFRPFEGRTQWLTNEITTAEVFVK